MYTLLHWFVAALAILVSALILPGIQVSGFVSALATAVVLGLLNIFLKPILLLLTLPINILTLGLFTLVVNAIIIKLASAVVPGFEVKSIWWAILFSVVLGVVNVLFGV